MPSRIHFDPSHEYDANRVLMIACAFPPTGGPGVQRTVKFVKYLPDHGWQPTVWTAPPLAGLPRDDSLVGDIPSGVGIQRFAGEGAGDVTLGALRRVSSSPGWLGSVAQALERRLTVRRKSRLFPDDRITWASRSLKPVLSLIERNRPRVIYSTFSPASNHWLALEVKQRTGLPWVADFRDLWTDDYRYVEGNAALGRADRELEQRILETADAIIGVTPRQTSILASHVPGAGHKFFTITNGFDCDDFAGDPFDTTFPAQGMTSDRPYVISHIGRLDRWRAVESFFRGLEMFGEGVGREERNIVFRVVGHVGSEVTARLRASGLTIEIIGYVPHRVAIHHMREADLLLLNVPDGPNADSVIPAKLFEYLASMRPILVIGPENNEAARIVRECGAGWDVGFDAKEIGAAFERAYLGWRGGCKQPVCPRDRLEEFGRKGLARRLATIFEQVLLGGSRQVAAQSLLSDAQMVACCTLGPTKPNVPRTLVSSS